MIPSAVQELQNRAVTRLIEESKTENNIVFKAPTGSGKTFMMADMMNRMLSENKNLVFLVSTLSKGGLAEQNYEAFRSYSNHFPHIKPYLITSETSGEEGPYIDPHHNVYVLGRDLYKNNSKLMQGPMDAFLRGLTGDLLVHGMGKIVYLIKDESHQKTNNLDSIADRFFTKTFSFSATPKLNRKKNEKLNVVISEEEAIEAHLIKRVIWGDDNDELDTALSEYTQLQKQYQKSFGINPCLIIQISNKNKADEEWKQIEPALNRHEIKWMYIVDKDKDCRTNTYFQGKPVNLWRKEVKKPTSPVEVVIFKLAISEGWDIPRACMLYQIRSTQSKQLDEQVLGRVRRNPVLLDFDKHSPENQDLATQAWVWGLKPKNATTQVPLKLADGRVKDELRIKTTVIKDYADVPGTPDVAAIMSEWKPGVTSSSIFELFTKWERASEEVRNIGQSHIQTGRDWFTFTGSIGKIEKEYRNAVCDYEKSMDLRRDETGKVEEVTVADSVNTLDTPDNQALLSDTIWRRLDGEDFFSFDSQAENKLAQWLEKYAAGASELSTTTSTIRLWGKNYPRTDIRFAYYSAGIHYSEPDFIFKDKAGRIHIFEVKSINEGGRFSADESQAYEEKINKLKEAYKQASKLTGHIFYIPIQRGAEFEIWRCEQGKEEWITKDDLRVILEQGS